LRLAPLRARSIKSRARELAEHLHHGDLLVGLGEGAKPTARTRLAEHLMDLAAEAGAAIVPLHFTETGAARQDAWAGTRLRE
jgi:hypothetical protein